MYSRRVAKETCEDYGFKHLYEGHHECIKDCRFCNGVFCEKGKSGHDVVRYKENDLFQLENEEMSSAYICVNYTKLKQYHEECN